MIRRLLWLLAVPILVMAQPVLPPQVCSASVTTNCVLVTNASGNVAIGSTLLKAAGANLTSTDQTTPSNPSSGKTAVYSKSGTLCSLSPAGAETCTGGVAWGSITGTLSAQTDLNTALGLKASAYQATVLSTSSPVTVAASATLYFNNSAGAMTFTLPTITGGLVGLQLCFRNYVSRTGALTLQLPASTFLDFNGANGTAAGTFVSAGAAGDSACVIATSTTQYVSFVGLGVWTNN